MYGRFCVILLFFVTALSAGPLQAQLDARMLSLMPVGTQQAMKEMASMEKDPNLDDEFQHLLYWMGEQRRCTLKQGNQYISVMAIMVMLDEAYQQFKPVLPNLESLLAMATMPRSQPLDGVVSEPAPITLRCRKMEPMPILQWLLPEVYRYRAEQAMSRQQASRS